MVEPHRGYSVFLDGGRKQWYTEKVGKWCPQGMVPELSVREWVRRRSRKKNRAGKGCYSGDAFLRQPFWILRYWNTSLSTGKVPLSSSSCLPQLCHPIFGPGQLHDPKPTGLRSGTLEAFQDLALWQGRSALTGMLLSPRLLAIPNITPGGRCTSSRNDTTSSVWRSQSWQVKHRLKVLKG